MLYALFYALFEGKPYFYESALFRAVMAILTAAAILFLLGPRTIRTLIRLKVGDLPEFDNKTLNELTAGKKNTPTMGGVLILLAIATATLLWADLSNFYIRMSFVLMVWLAALGAVDDWLKLTRKRPGASRDGLSSGQKLLFQIAISVLISAFLIRHSARVQGLTSVDWTLAYNLIFYKHPVSIESTALSIGLQADFARILGSLVFIFTTTVVITGASNAVNLTDGMDGLAAGCMGIVGFVFMMLCFLAGSVALAGSVLPDPLGPGGFPWAAYLGLPQVVGADEVAVLCGAIIGACLGFLWFNCSPAQVFMGDTGSLLLGGLIGYAAVVTRQELMLFIVGGVFVLEACSVMLQVGYFKYTKRRYGEGRRVLKMAPLHHHFQLSGWPEQQVVIRFWLIGLFCACLALASVKLR